MSAIKVLFVCYANICRSPMAMAIFQHQISKAGLSGKISVKSAGIAGQFAGSPFDKNGILACSQNNISLAGSSTALTKEMILSSDYVLAMDKKVLSAIYNLGSPDQKSNIIGLMAEYSVFRRPSNQEIPDPVGLPLDAFHDVFVILYDAGLGLLEKIREKHLI